MERSEPALVPEWLRSAGSVAGAGSSAHHLSSASTNTDASSVVHQPRNRPSKSNSDFDSPRSLFFERTSSSNSRRGSMNGSAKHAYSSFSRNHHDKDRDREKERSSFGEPWDRDSSNPLSNIFSGRAERDTLRHSHSLVPRKQSELLSRRVAVDAKSIGNGNQHHGNGILSGGGIGSSIQKAVFDKDFPSLGTEEKQGAAEIGRVSSPTLGITACQSLPVGSSALIGGEGWTSALAEVPIIIGSSNIGSLTAQQTGASNSVSAAPSATAGLNMAEALAQTPSRTRSTPQVLVKAQRLEELAIKQSRQLIPMTPSLPKASALNSSEKLKPKTSARNAEMNVPAKSGPQHLSLHIANQSLRSVNVKSDTPKTSGKFTDLKSVVWENGVSPTSKDVSNQTNYSNSKPGNQLTVTSAGSSGLSRNPSNVKSPTERKPASMDLKLGSTMEKKPSLSQAQSRNDFFNLIKKKTLVNSSSVLPDSDTLVTSTIMEKPDAITREVVSPPANPEALGNGADVSNGDVCEDERLPNSKKNDTVSSLTIYPDEEEAAFLRSLGWEENSGEDEGLTEEEINAFYQECMKLGPATFKLRGIQPNLSKLLDSYATNLHGASAELSTSDSGSQA
ncbi:uncharacterized protein LOC129303287 [Prosopis cineraria]|uniref:uncharacterized protein LOC129300004 n=1 Tax=Prosopis cineraria TaxID=364024 RepID=UPI00240F80DF|nr:uncharacterized protein LOC129300004 [Prosopis cineraria]XP_054798480.1 uncharacterized protein LOC129303287 [Prosopis cineraria]